jgi:hypothetical protein
VAKAKAAKSGNSHPTNGAKRTAPGTKAGTASSAEKRPSAEKTAAFSDVVIGHTAGDVWGLLSDGGPKTLAEVKKSVKAPADVVVAAIGWLAREDKLEFVTNGKTVKIGLRSSL